MTTALKPPDRRERLRELEARIGERYAAAASNLWQIGQDVLEVRIHELWRDEAFASFDAWLDSDRVPVSRYSGYKALIAVQAA